MFGKIQRREEKWGNSGMSNTRKPQSPEGLEGLGGEREEEVGPAAGRNPQRVYRWCLELLQPREEVGIILTSPFLPLQELILKPAVSPGSLVMDQPHHVREHRSEGWRNESESRVGGPAHCECCKPQTSTWLKPSDHDSWRSRAVRGMVLGCRR